VVPIEAAGRVLARAADKSGDVEPLAQRLGIGAGVLKLCMEGREPVSEQLYLRAVDIVLGEAPPAKPNA
jgi:hypothetical protein